MAALAPMPMSIAHVDSPGSIAATRAIVTSAEFMMRRKADMEKRTLVIGGSPNFVTAFREAGFNAFGALTDDHPGVTKWHAVANADALSFHSKIFNAVYFLQNNPMNNTAFNEMKEAVRMVSSGGYLIFDEKQYEDWPVLLRFWKWEKMPISFAGMAIWKRTFNENDLGWFYRNSMKKIGRTVIPFKQSWAMQKILASA